MRKKRVKWIGKALKRSRRGALHRQLGVPLTEVVPVAKLRKAARAPGKLGRRARLALNLRKLGKKRRRK